MRRARELVTERAEAWGDGELAAAAARRGYQLRPALFRDSGGRIGRAAIGEDHLAHHAQRREGRKTRQRPGQRRPGVQCRYDHAKLRHPQPFRLLGYTVDLA